MFNAAGLIQREEDRQGNQKLYDYFTSTEASAAGNSDLTGHLEKVIDPNGNYIALGYDSSELVTSLTDNYGRVTTLTRTSGEITSVTYPDPDGAGSLLAPRVEIDYNAAGQISAKRVYPDESNSTGDLETAFTYDTSGRLDQIDLPNGNTREVTPEFGVGTNLGTMMSRATLVKSSTAYGYSTEDGVVTRTKYNAYGQTIETVENYLASPTDPLVENITTSSAYYAAGGLRQHRYYAGVVGRCRQAEVHDGERS